MDDQAARTRKQTRTAAHGPSRDGFLVLGMHRSGTSSVAGTLVKLGATAPKTIMEGRSDNPRGHWESVAITAFHDELLASAQSKWDDWRSFDSSWFDKPIAAQFKAHGKSLLISEFGDSPVFVLKDPRVCRMARFWLEIFTENRIVPHVVIPIRTPIEVALSLLHRDGFMISRGLLLWLRHVLDAEAATRHLPRTIINWDNFLLDWRSSLVNISANFQRPWLQQGIYATREIEEFLSSDLRHERVSSAAALNHPEFHPWMTIAYTSLLKLIDDPKSTDTHKSLDRISSQLEETSNLFLPLLATSEAHADTMYAAAKSAEAARAATEIEAHKLQAALQAMTSERDAALSAHTQIVSSTAETIDDNLLDTKLAPSRPE